MHSAKLHVARYYSRCPVSVCLSHSSILSRQLTISSFFSRPGSPIILVFSTKTPLQNSKGTRWTWAGNRDRLEKFAIFGSRSILETSQDMRMVWIIIGSHRYPIDPQQFRRQRLTVKDSMAQVFFSGGSSYVHSYTVWPTAMKFGNTPNNTPS